jgi:hypothetical protein
MRLSVLHVLLVAVGACGAEPPDEGGGSGSGSGSVPDAGDRSDPPPGMPTLTLDAVPSSTPYSRLPVSGAGPPLGTVVAQTASASVATTAGTDGGFCLDVPLQLGIANTIWFQALDPTGVYSDEIQVTVHQGGDPPPTGDNQQAPEFRNIALFGAITHGGLSEDDGVFGHLNDGDPNSSVVLKNQLTADCSGQWFSIKLAEKAPIHQVRVRSSAGCPFDASYKVFLTEEENPPPAPTYFPFGCWPNTWSDPWFQIAEVDEGGSEVILDPPLSVQPVARHIGFHWKGGGGCGPLIGTRKNEILEIEVITKKGDQDQPPPPEPSCASGGAPQ